MHIYFAVPLLVFIVPALSEVHNFFSGFFSGQFIISAAFDDSTNSLSLVNNITTSATDGSKWIAIDEQKNNIYVATTGYFQSYTITTDLNLAYESNMSLSSECQNANFIAAATIAPYTVIGTPYSSGCSSLAISVDASGALQEGFANVTYNSAAGVHGVALSSDNNFIYSADDMGNAVWAHSYNSSTGAVEEIQYLPAANKSDPRHLVVHPNDQWVYVVYEGVSTIAVYSRKTTTGMLTFTNTTYPLLPSGYTNSSLYWADEALFSIPSSNSTASTSPKYLVAATRSRTVSLPGYVSAFALDANTGAITEQLFLLPTTASGGSANAVAPAAFSEEYFAITDSGSNFIEMWKMEKTGNGTTASAVAHLDAPGGPANVVWYS